jgi:hypothetical protein
MAAKLEPHAANTEVYFDLIHLFPELRKHGRSQHALSWLGGFFHIASKLASRCSYLFAATLLADAASKEYLLKRATYVSGQRTRAWRSLYMLVSLLY